MRDSAVWRGVWIVTSRVVIFARRSARSNTFRIVVYGLSVLASGKIHAWIRGLGLSPSRLSANRQKWTYATANKSCSAGLRAHSRAGGVTRFGLSPANDRRYLRFGIPVG